jgi:pyruvate-formate lyase
LSLSPIDKQRANRETLTNIHEHPDQGKDVIVRVAGYSAYFVKLTKALQDDIVARTELDMAG